MTSTEKIYSEYPSFYRTIEDPTTLTMLRSLCCFVPYLWLPAKTTTQELSRLTLMFPDPVDTFVTHRFNFDIPMKKDLIFMSLRNDHEHTSDTLLSYIWNDNGLTMEDQMMEMTHLIVRYRKQDLRRLLYDHE